MITDEEKFEGRIIKGIGGFYYIKSAGSSCLLEAKPIGLFRHQHITPTVGDYVTLEREGDQYTMVAIQPRKNLFVRPPVANVDLAVIVFALKKPKPNTMLLDKLLVGCEAKGVRAVICFTKADLAGDKDRRILEVYSKTPYPVVTMAPDDDGALAELQGYMKDHTTFLAGPSGVGKSTLTNRLCRGKGMETGDLSEKLGRGKHTTRHVELLALEEGGYLLDTPGFSSLQLEDGIEADFLESLFPEFTLGQCRFNSCTHRAEPDCAVKAQLEAGTIAPSRYDHYVEVYDELKRKEAIW